MELAELGTVLQIANHVGASNPVSFAGRLLGLGEAEQRAGIPAWAWGGILLTGGIVAGVVLAPRVKRLVENGVPWTSQGGKKPNGNPKVFGRWS